MTSLIAAIVLASPVPAQTLVPGAVEWHPVGGPPAPRQLPGDVRDVEPVQFKPAPQSPMQPPPAPRPTQEKAPRPTQEKLPEPRSLGSGRIAVPLGTRIREAETESDLAIKTNPPGIDALTKRQSEAQFYEELRMEQAARPGTSRIYFPEEEPVSTEPYTGRRSPFMPKFVEPAYVNHEPLYFEQKNWERYGWDLGPIQPGVEVVQYYYDLLLLPYHVGSETCHCFDSSAGKCLPGDNVPLLCYGERFSVTGLVFQAGAVFGGLFAFP